MKWSSGPVEQLGVLLLLGAWFCSLATVLTPSWLTLSSDLLPTEIFQLGLWKTCVVQEMGLHECRPYNSLLGLPPEIRLAQMLMCAALGSGLVGLLLAILGLKLITCCCPRVEDLNFKKVLKAAGGTLSLGSGMLVLVPVSYIAHLTVVRFFDGSVPDVAPRWEFGVSLFCGWTAGVLHLVAGALLLASCQSLEDPNQNRPAHIPMIPVQSRYQSRTGPPWSKSCAPDRQRSGRTRDFL